MERATDRMLLFTSSFRENCIFAVKAMLFIFMVFGYFNLIEPEYMGSFNASLIDKADRLQSINEEKIVLIGNSNLAFGINSEMIEQEFGKPVVNMGLHGGLGNVFHEQMAKLNVCEGDIYIICHSEYDDNDRIGNCELAWLTIENHYNLWRLIRAEDVWGMLNAFPVYLRKTIDLYSSGTGNIDNGGRYSRSAFNEYGDFGIYREGSIWTKLVPVKCPSISDESVERINKLNKYLEKRGAVLLIAGYPIGNGEVTAEKSEFIAFERNLKDRMDCAVISDYLDYMFDYSYFYDYNYLHLNSEGAALRTQQLIDDLREWQNEK